MSNKVYLFKSERLGFRNWIAEDVKPFSAMNSDESVMNFFPNPLTHEETQGFVKRLQRHFENFGYTFFAVDKLENGELIGFIGLVKTAYETDFTPCVEIGWRLKTAAWNKGYATEGAFACLGYGFNTLGFTEIYSFTPVLNENSEKVMIKIGMEKIGAFNHPKVEKGHRLEKHVLYKINNK